MFNKTRHSRIYFIRGACEREGEPRGDATDLNIMRCAVRKEACMHAYWRHTQPPQERLVTQAQEREERSLRNAAMRAWAPCLSPGRKDRSVRRGDEGGRGWWSDDDDRLPLEWRRKNKVHQEGGRRPRKVMEGSGAMKAGSISWNGKGQMHTTTKWNETDLRKRQMRDDETRKREEKAAKRKLPVCCWSVNEWMIKMII